VIEIERLDKDLNNVAMVAESARRLCLQWEKGLMLFDIFALLTELFLRARHAYLDLSPFFFAI